MALELVKDDLDTLLFVVVVRPPLVVGVRLLNSTGRHEVGKGILAEILVPKSSSYAVYTRRAWMFASIGNFDNALADYTKAFKLKKPDHNYIRHRHALVDRLRTTLRGSRGIYRARPGIFRAHPQPF